MDVRDTHITRGRIEKLEKSIDDLHSKLDQLLEMLTPVHAHASWVTSLRERLHSIGIVRNRIEG